MPIYENERKAARYAEDVTSRARKLGFQAFCLTRSTTVGNLLEDQYNGMPVNLEVELDEDEGLLAKEGDQVKVIVFVHGEALEKAQEFLEQEAQDVRSCGGIPAGDVWVKRMDGNPNIAVRLSVNFPLP